MTKQERQAIDVLVDAYRRELIEDIKRRKRITSSPDAEAKFDYYKECIADYFGLSKNHAFNVKSREATVILCRQMLGWICRVGETSLPWKMKLLGQKLGYADHSSIVHSVKEMNARLFFTYADRTATRNILEIMGYELVKENDKYTNRYKHETIPS